MTQRGEINRFFFSRDEQQLYEINKFFMNKQFLEQDREFREAHVKSVNEMEELKRFQGSTFYSISRRILIEDRDTILEFR